MCTNKSAIFNLTTTAIGSGILSLVYAVANSGYVVGMILFLWCGFMSWHCCVCMGKCMELGKKLSIKRGHTGAICSIEEVADLAWGKVGEIAVACVIYWDLFFSCVVMCVCMGKTVSSSFHDYKEYLGNVDLEKLFGFANAVDPEQRRTQIMVVIICILITPIVNLKSMAELGNFAFAGVCASFILVGAIIIDGCMVIYDRPAGTDMGYQAFGGASIFEALGVIAFAFSVAEVCPTLYTEMKTPAAMPKVAGYSLIMVVSLYLICSGVGYYAYGNTAASVDIVQDVMQSRFLKLLVTMCICSNLAMTVPLLMNPIGQALERYILSRRDANEPFVRYTCRTTLMVVVAFCAMVVPHVSALQGFVGAFTTTLICFAIPNALCWSLHSQLDMPMEPKFKYLIIVCLIFSCSICINGIIFDGTNLYNKINGTNYKVL